MSPVRETRPPRRAARAVAIMGLALVAAACGDRPEEAPPPPTPPPPAGTQAMIDRLAAIEDPADYARLAAEWEARPAPDDLRGRLTWQAVRAQLLSRAGRIADARVQLEETLAAIDRLPGQVPADSRGELLDLYAIVVLWGALEDACLADFEPCLFPPPALSSPGSAQAARALELYLELVATNPGNPQWRWLVNIAAMAAGRYPDAVPVDWRLPDASLRPEDDIGRFVNRAEALGVDAPGRAGGSIMEDLDGDGDLDLMASSLSLTDGLRVYRNDGGRFVDTSLEAGVAGLTGGLNMIHADYDEDGDVDVFVLRGGWSIEGQPNSLLRNDGGGRFEDVTEAAGVLSTFAGQTASWVDFDGDGDLDLFIGNESDPRISPPQLAPAELYRNDGEGRFTEIAADVGLDVIGYIKAVAWGDYDDDGRPDVYLSRYPEPNQLFRNEGPGADGAWRFRDVTAELGVAEPVESFPAWFWDYDNDGHLDLFVSGYRLAPGDVLAEYLGRPDVGALPRLYRNRGDGTFEDATAAAGLERILYTMGSNYGDLDNDGWLDFYAGTGEPNLRAIMPNRMFRNDRGRFLDVTRSGGFGHMGKGHGVAFGDLDADGDQDLYVVIGGAVLGDVGENVLWENPGHGHRWITLRLEGVEANRSAIGARLRVDVETPSGARSIHLLVGSGGSFGSSSLQQEIGLGDATAISGIEISWPGSGTVDRLGPVPLDAVYAVREGGGRAEPVEVAPTPLGGG